MNDLSPTEIRRVPTGLLVKWSDGTTSEFNAENLRRSCPCAECREKRGDGSHSTPLTPKKRSLAVIDSSLTEAIKLDAIEAVGGYAIRLKWGDGHNVGIYTFSFLAELAGGRH